MEGPGPWRAVVPVVLNRSRPNQKNSKGNIFLGATFFVLLLAFCALSGWFDHGQPIVDDETVPAIPVVPFTEDDFIASPSSHRVALVDAHVISTPPSQGASKSLLGMEREVLELEKQIQLHMSSREGSLVHALKVTDKCASTDADCNDAHDQLKWKVSQDQYEQGAMQAILKGEGKKVNSTKEGAALFKQYAAKADELSGLRSLSKLNQVSSNIVHEHTIQERANLEVLRREEEKLRSLRMEERRDRDAKQAETQSAVLSRTRAHMAQELARMNGAECPTAGCDGTAAEAGEAVAVPATESAYLRDFAQAEGIEALRREAFLANERALHAKVRSLSTNRDSESDEDSPSPLKDVGHRAHTHSHARTQTQAQAHTIPLIGCRPLLPIAYFKFGCRSPVQLDVGRCAIHTAASRLL